MPWSLPNDAAWIAMVNDQVPWQSHPIIGELWQARVERVPSTTPATLDDLDVIQYMPGTWTPDRWPWQGLQQWLVTHCVDFSVAHSRAGGVLSKLPPGSYDNTNYVTGSINKFTVYKMFELAGLARSAIDYGFRHATTWPANWMDTNDPAYSLVLPADIGSKPNGILGPWILYDLWTCLNLLVRVEQHIIWAFVYEDNERRSAARSYVSPDAAYAEASAGWDESWWGNIWPFAYYSVRQWGNPPDPIFWDVMLHRACNKMRLQTLPSLPGAEIDWYVAGRTFDDSPSTPGDDARFDFDDFGDNILEGKWRAVATGTALANGITGGPMLGNIANMIANRPPAPPYTGSGRVRGWQPRDQTAIIRADIPGGFEYQFDL